MDIASFSAIVRTIASSYHGGFSDSLFLLGSEFKLICLGNTFRYDSNLPFQACQVTSLCSHPCSMSFFLLLGSVPPLPSSSFPSTHKSPPCFLFSLPTAATRDGSSTSISRLPVKWARRIKQVREGDDMGSLRVTCRSEIFWVVQNRSQWNVTRSVARELVSVRLT